MILVRMSSGFCALSANRLWKSQLIVAFSASYLVSSGIRPPKQPRGCSSEQSATTKPQ